MDQNSEVSQVTDTLRRIVTIKNINNVVPVISNSFRIEQIFRDEKSVTEAIPEDPQQYVDEDLTVDQQLTRLWAKDIGYPKILTDNNNLARVAQYHQVENDGSDVAKEEYLEFLKKTLLNVNENKEGYGEWVKEHKNSVNTMSFSDIAKGVDAPQFPDGATDPLLALAQMPFPVYITTSYHDFLERALRSEEAGKKVPRTQVIFWEPGREYDDAVEAGHYPDPAFRPTATSPVVYHLYGLENYPGSLVLSEDDYMKFLVSVVSDTDNQRPIVPPKLTSVLSASHLFLMGYHLSDWDFRVLFRFILNYRHGESSKKGVYMQVKPKKQDEQMLKYLEHYFDMKKFEVEWNSSEDFVQALWKVYKDSKG